MRTAQSIPSRIVVIAVSALGITAVACTGIPDFRFDGDDAGLDASSAPRDSGAPTPVTDGSVVPTDDAGVTPEAGVDAGAADADAGNNCPPGVIPPIGGSCCGYVICIGTCDPAACDKCRECDSKDICCVRRDGQVQCKGKSGGPGQTCGN